VIRVFFCIASLLVLPPARVFAEPPNAALLKLHTAEAAAYHMYLDQEQRKEMEFRDKPIFNWTNLVGEHTQLGHLFLWTDHERPAVIGTVFSTQATNPRERAIIHEFHTLSPDQVFPATPRDSAYQWHPKTGINLSAVAGAPPVGATAAQRSKQIRDIARKFSAESQGMEKKWELRLLPTPLFQYEPKSDEVLQGALLAMVSSAGTDPEVLLLIEARHPPRDDKAWQWQAAALRFSDKDLAVRYNDKPLWSSLDDESHRVAIKNNYTLIETPDKTYSCYRARLVPELKEEE
jgi:hypothetical protein